MSEKPSVIIAAHNEERLIGRTLESLDLEFVARPIVVVNGSDDRTAKIAIEHDADVHILTERNKHAALKYGMEQLEPDARLAPILFMDADSYPESTFAWSSLLTATLLQSGKPAAAAVPIGFCDGWSVRDNRLTHKWDEAMQEHIEQDLPRFSGQAMGIYIKSEKIFKALMNMDLIWPGEDYAIARVIQNHGGSMHQITDPTARVITSSRRYPRLWKRMLHGGKWASRQLNQSYLDEAPPDTRPYRPNSKRGY